MHALNHSVMGAREDPCDAGGADAGDGLLVAMELGEHGELTAEGPQMQELAVLATSAVIPGSPGIACPVSVAIASGTDDDDLDPAQCGGS